MLAAQQRASEIHVQGSQPIVEGKVDKRESLGDARVVHDHIASTISLSYLAECGVDRGRLSNVELQGLGR